MKIKHVGITLAIVVGLLATGCGTLKDYLPENFDNSEYMKLAEMSYVSKMSNSCDVAELETMKYWSGVLMHYSDGTLKENITDIYTGIHELTIDVLETVDPSVVYCRIERQKIDGVIGEAMDTFGDRKK
jgi:hypothetical protein